MNKTELRKLYLYKLEIKVWEEERERLKAESEVRAQKLDGMPRAQKKSDPTGDKGVTLADIELIIEDLEYRALEKTKEIYEFMRDIDDPLIRLIIKYRCVELLKWREVAAKINPSYTDESVRKMFDRYFDMS